jgi:polar amino acid transport system substrate-binding protein
MDERFRPLSAVAVEWDYRVIVAKKIADGADNCTQFNLGLKAVHDNGEFERLHWPDRPGNGAGENSPS